MGQHSARYKDNVGSTMSSQDAVWDGKSDGREESCVKLQHVAVTLQNTLQKWLGQWGTWITIFAFAFVM